MIIVCIRSLCYIEWIVDIAREVFKCKSSRVRNVAFVQDAKDDEPGSTINGSSIVLHVCSKRWMCGTIIVKQNKYYCVIKHKYVIARISFPKHLQTYKTSI